MKIVLELIDGWDLNETFTWDNLCKKYEHKFKSTTTRQRLARHNRIKLAYENKKKSISTGQVVVNTMPSSLKNAQLQIEQLKNTIQRLEKENNLLLEQFKIWQYNAYCAGVNEFQLNKALPQIERGGADD